MKTLMMAVVLALFANMGWAQTETTVESRFGATSHAQTLRMLEVYQTRGNSVAWDLGHIDFGAEGYHELFVGVGHIFTPYKKLTLIEELYFVQAVGADANGARYVQPFTVAIIPVTAKLGGFVKYFPYVPLNHAARIQHVLDEASLKYDFGRFKLGGGYAAYRYGDQAWDQLPFVSGVIKLGRAGALDVWFQKTLSGNQIRFNYSLSRKK
ncbi:MAG: hypothetical protein KW802_01415 [Candidatus Doudnabacteria bacterium]|nr:hypothetical protein [Candidatus Doudnabacteria bacterium]